MVARILSVSRRLAGHRRPIVVGAILLIAATLALPHTPGPAGPPADPSSIAAWFDAQRADAGIPGAAIAVVRDGSPVLVRGFGTARSLGGTTAPVTEATPFVLGSVSKSITALAVMQLVERGRVDLGAPARSYVPELGVGDRAGPGAITVRELLDQTSGLSTGAGSLAVGQAAGSSLAGRVAALGPSDLAAAPGSGYRYSNANYVVLGRLVETVSGLSFDRYLTRSVFAPLGMTTATADRARADAEALGDAHRLFFGLADTHRPLDRPDLVSAGWIEASAEDMARYLGALLDPLGPGRGRVLSASSVAAMFSGAAPTGIGGDRYAMGWVDSTFDAERIVAHAGSTTDMASFVAVVPARRLAVAVLFDAQSPLYELLRKPDSIGLGVLALAMGHEPGGTLERFYPVVDAAFAAYVLLSLRSLRRTARRRDRPTSAPTTGGRPTTVARLAAIGSLVLRAYLDGVVPVAIALGAPGVLGAGWGALIRTDVGVMLASVALLRVADGMIRVAGVVRRLRRGGGDSRLAPAATAQVG